MVTTLATISTTTKGDPLKVFLYTALLIGIVVILTAVLLFVRRKTKSMGGEVVQSSSIMDSLRRMHAEGKLSDEEFQAARAKLVSKIRTGIEKPSPEKSAQDSALGVSTPSQGGTRATTQPVRARPVPGQPKPTIAPPPLPSTDDAPPTGGKTG